MTEVDREPVLRVMPGPGDINANGHIFGGWVLSQMDIAAGIVASRRARGPVATIALFGLSALAVSWPVSATLEPRARKLNLVCSLCAGALPSLFFLS